jgi:predicted nuclease of predicted toxin-antitoxin system
MNILLDENLDWRLRRDLPGHTVESVPLIGWAGLKNGELLAKAEKRFDVLLTMDSNMVHQQSLARFRISIIALQARSNRLGDTRPLMSKVLALLPTLTPGTMTLIS